MNQERIAFRLSNLSEHDRFVAEAQLARAEAIADAFSGAANLIRQAWSKLASSRNGRPSSARRSRLSRRRSRSPLTGRCLSK